ncbi:MAG: ABC transporter permease [Christensenellaceae bacterium]|nr:ABC transporter permease [Christensenellaceae bacterium]
MSKAIENKANGQNKARSAWSEIIRRFKKSKPALFGLMFILFLVLVSLVTIVLDISNPEIYNNYVIKQNLRNKLDPPSWQHPFGCDEFGRDILFRVIWGTRYSLFIGLISIMIALFLGGTFGAIAGYYGKHVDNIIMRIMDVFLAIPSMVMAVAVVAALGTSTSNLLLAIAIPQAPRLARIVRASVMTVKDKEYIEATRALGASNATIIVKYVLPNAMAPIIVQASLSVGTAILNIAGLSFLGIGVQPPTPEWGSILSSARTYMRDAWHISVIPGLVIMITVLSLNLAGDGLRDAMDPKLKN